MSDKERAVALLEYVPPYKMGYVLAYLQGLTADEEADDAFCENMYREYLNDPDRGDFVSLEFFIFTHLSVFLLYLYPDVHNSGSSPKLVVNSLILSFSTC